MNFNEKLHIAKEQTSLCKRYADKIFDELNDRRGVNMDEFEDQIQDEIKERISWVISEAVVDCSKLVLPKG